MKTNSNAELVQRLKELNALIARHVEKVKEDIKLMNDALRDKQAQVARAYPRPIPGTEKLAREWRESLN